MRSGKASDAGARASRVAILRSRSLDLPRFDVAYLMHEARHRGFVRVNLFPKWANAPFRVALAAGAGAIVGTPIAMIAWARTPYATGQDEPAPQPVKFDHRHHVQDDGIGCLFCHAEAPRSKTAGMPATEICMGCHTQIWTSSPELARVRTSAFENQPIHWNRVNRLPDFVFFDHSVHVNKGVGCVTCHGRVDLMGQVFAARNLTMDFCLDCHREPDKQLRSLDRIADMEWTPEPGEGAKVARQLGVRSLTHCSTCHR